MNQYSMNNGMSGERQTYPQSGAAITDEIHSGTAATGGQGYGMTPGQMGMQGGQIMPAEQIMPGVQTMPAVRATPAAQNMARTGPSAVDQPNLSSLPQPSTLQMEHGLSQEVIESPITMQEAFAGSMKSLLGKNVGHYVIASFLIGTQEPVSWQGFLHEVGNDYIVIFQPDMGRYVTCDLYSLKFVEFHDQKGVVPPCVGTRRRDAARIW